MRLEATAAGRGTMTDIHLPTAGGFPAPGLLVRKSEEITDLIDLFSKTQYRAKEVTPQVLLFSLYFSFMIRYYFC